MLGCAQLLHL
jgi:hypothetical protein